MSAVRMSKEDIKKKLAKVRGKTLPSAPEVDEESTVKLKSKAEALAEKRGKVKELKGKVTTGGKRTTSIATGEKTTRQPRSFINLNKLTEIYNAHDEINSDLRPGKIVVSLSKGDKDEGYARNFYKKNGAYTFVAPRQKLLERDARGIIGNTAGKIIPADTFRIRTDYIKELLRDDIISGKEIIKDGAFNKEFKMSGDKTKTLVRCGAVPIDCVHDLIKSDGAINEKVLIKFHKTIMGMLD